jgi:zinc protease
LGRSDLVAHHVERYSPEGMVLAVVGAASPDLVVDKVMAALGDWQAPQAHPDRTIPPNVTLTARRQEVVSIPGKSQSDLILGWPAMARGDPDFIKASLANTVLGVFGMMGRLGDRVRDQQGLAYYVYSQVESGLGPGPWTATAGVNPANVQRAIDGILHEVCRLRDEPVPEEELADSQAYLTGSMPLRLETNQGVLSAILDMERHQLGLDYLQRFSGLINAVTVQDLQEMAQKYLDPDVYALAIAGPQDE